jgi:hypothetical protein
VKQDYAKLARWAKLLRSGDVAIGKIRKGMADEVVRLIDEGFAKQKDPYGVPWAPKKRDDGRMILHGPTGRLRSGWRPVLVGVRKFFVAPSVDYAAPHQAPRFNRRPRRAMVPYGKNKLPLKWRLRLMKAAIFEFVKHIRSGLRR